MPSPPTRRQAHRGQDTRRIPYDMFDLERTEREAETARRLASIYHKGQEHAWDGRAVLAACAAAHGGVRLAPEKLAALQRIINLIFWGELVAWRVSAALANEVEPLEVKLAATAQAHDEARHFYVLRDWMALAGYSPAPVGPGPARFLADVGGEASFARKLIGLQMTIEPVALTIFHLLREARVEPVLADVLAYFERDEARHVALGVNWLPELLRGMRRRELVALGAWQVRVLNGQLNTLGEMAPDLRVLGLDPREVFRLGHRKQREIVAVLQEQMGKGTAPPALIQHILEFQVEWRFPRSIAPRSLPARLGAALRAARAAAP